jgi:hypothetical protein
MKELPMKTLFILVALLVAAPALATDDVWVKAPQGSGTDLGCKLPKDRYCYYDTSTTAATPILKTHGCQEITVTFVANITDNTTFVNTAQVFRFFGDHEDTTADANDDEAIAINGITLNGDPSTQTDTIYGFDSVMTYISVTNSTGTSRITMHCPNS